MTIGNKPDGKPFPLYRYTKPFWRTNRNNSLHSVDDRSVVSSGVYERYLKRAVGPYLHLGFLAGYQKAIFECNNYIRFLRGGDALNTACFILKRKWIKTNHQLDNVDAGALRTLHFLEKINDTILK